MTENEIRNIISDWPANKYLEISDANHTISDTEEYTSYVFTNLTADRYLYFPVCKDHPGKTFKVVNFDAVFNVRCVPSGTDTINGVAANAIILANWYDFISMVTDWVGATSTEDGGYVHPNHSGDATSVGDGVITLDPDAKNPPIDADRVLYQDSTAANNLVRSTWTQVKAFLKTYFDTLYNLYVHPNHSGDATSAGDGAISMNPDAKNPPIDADLVLYQDTAAANNLVKSTWTQIKAFLKTYFDTLYLPITSRRSDHIDINISCYSSITAGTWTLYVNSSQLGNGYIYNSSAANNDQINFLVSFEAGTWSCGIIYLKFSYCGILDLLIDGVSVGTSDAYAAVVTWTQRLIFTGLVITEGIHTVSIKVTGKNVSSTGYVLDLSHFGFWRTS